MLYQMIKSHNLINLYFIYHYFYHSFLKIQNRLKKVLFFQSFNKSLLIYIIYSKKRYFVLYFRIMKGFLIHFLLYDILNDLLLCTNFIQIKLSTISIFIHNHCFSNILHFLLFFYFFLMTFS